MQKDDVKYPNLTVQLTGQNGNAFVIMGLVTNTMKRAKVSQETINAYMAEATSGDYDHLLRTTMRYVNVD